MNVSRRRLLAALVLGIAVVGCWFAYAPALGGPFLLDDFSNLGGLALVEDTRSALVFAFSGFAGPLGRPVALATFLPQAAAWGGAAEPFLRVNILIHLLNACILAWVLHRLAIVSRVREEKALFVAIAAASLWLFLPLLASASLLVVQRMTTLSALFVLLGLAGYLHARQSIERNPVKALVGMSLSLIVGTALAALTKENGALLPTFVLIVEATVLRSPGNVRQSHWRGWVSVFLALPTVMILAYLAWRVPYSPEVVLRRDFTAWERLLTQSRILWEYLFNAFVPQATRLGPFHDDYPVARSITDPVTFLAFSGWVVTFVAALFFRRRYPLFAFSVLWFLGGHLLESTVVPLELYYEHRNYLPIVGPVYALFVLAARAPATRKMLVGGGAAIYILMNAAVLLNLASLWGNPDEAFPYWKERSPDSVYSITAAIRHELAVAGPRPALRSIRQLAEAKPELGYVKLQELKLSCDVNPSADHRKIIADLDRLLKHVDLSYTASAMLSQLTEQYDCNGVDADAVRKLASSLIANPRYRDDSLYNQLHHKLMAFISQQEGNSDQAIRHLQRAVEYGPSREFNTMIVYTYVQMKNFRKARAYIDDARSDAPFHPLKRYVWLRELDSLSGAVDEFERRVAPEADIGRVP